MICKRAKKQWFVYQQLKLCAYFDQFKDNMTLTLWPFYLEQNTKKIFLGNVLNKVLIRIMLGLVNQKLYLVHDK